MKNPDEAIERVLAGLRDVEAPAGLERRVLAAMEERAAVRGSRRPGLGWVVGLGVAAVVVAGVLIVRAPKVQVEKVAGVHALAVKPVVENEPKRNTGVSPLRVRSGRDDVNFREVQRGEQVRRMEVAVVEKVEERGFPAPPMPLTEEEKLLLRVAHRVDPQELTPLNAEARQREQSEFDREFVEFFAVPEMASEEKQMDPTGEATTEVEKGEAR